MTASLNIDYVSRVMEALLIDAGLQILLEDKASGAAVHVPVDSAVAADGLLPIFLSAGEALWRDATGETFGLRSEKDISAYFDWRVQEIEAARFSALILATMEALSQAATPQGIMAVELGRVFDDAIARIEDREGGSP